MSVCLERDVFVRFKEKWREERRSSKDEFKSRQIDLKAFIF